MWAGVPCQLSPHWAVFEVFCDPLCQVLQVETRREEGNYSVAPQVSRPGLFLYAAVEVGRKRRRMFWNIYFVSNAEKATSVHRVPRGTFLCQLSQLCHLFRVCPVGRFQLNHWVSTFFRFILLFIVFCLVTSSSHHCCVEVRQLLICKHLPWELCHFAYHIVVCSRAAS